MAELKSLTDHVQALDIGNNKGKKNPKKEVEPPMMKLMRGVRDILTKHRNREAWRKAALIEHATIHELLDGIRDESKACVDLVEARGPSIQDREAMIKNSSGNITQEMMDNQREWREYIARVVIAQGHVITSLNLLELLVKEWKSREVKLKEFWDRFEKENPYGDEALPKIIEETTLLLRRQNFLQGKWAAMEPKYEALMETPPTWIEWNVEAEAEAEAET